LSDNETTVGPDQFTRYERIGYRCLANRPDDRSQNTLESKGF